MDSFRSLDGWLRAFVVIGVILVVAEAADGFRIDFPVAAWGFAAVMAVAVWWTWSGKAAGRIGGPIVAILLQLMELSGVALTYPRPVGAFETSIYWFFGVMTVVCIFAASGVLVTSLQARRRGPAVRTA